MTHLARFVAAVAALGLSVSACGSGPEADSLGAIELRPSAAESLDRIDIAGIPEDVILADADLWLRHDGTEVPVPILHDDAGAFFLAPLHPASPAEGGSMELIFEHAGARSSPLELEVTPLPAAPGAWDEAVAHLHAAIAHRAEESGMTFAQLQAADLEDLPLDLGPLKLAQVYIDDGSDNDLESLLTSPQHGLTAEDRRLIDSLVAKLDMQLLVGDVPRISMFRSPGTSTTSQQALPSRLTGFAGSGCRNAGIQIRDAADLAAKMQAARANQIVEGEAEQRVLNGIGTVTTVGGFLPGIGSAVSAVGTLFTAVETYKNGVAGLYPSQLVNLTAEISGDMFTEDFPGGHGWHRVKVTASSTGWAADTDVARTVLSAFTTTRSVAGDVGGLSLVEGFALNVDNLIITSGGGAVVERYSNLLDFCSETWTVNITGEPWSSGRALLDRFAVDSSARSFEPKETGLNLPVDDTLRIEANPAEFAGQTLHLDYPISVQPIILSGPDEIVVSRPGESIEVEIGIRNAFDPELDWSSDAGHWIGNPTITGGDPSLFGSGLIWTRTHETSTNEADYPYFATVESVSISGLRADGDPPRRRVFTFRLAEIIVEPNPVTMAVETTQQFTARDRDGRAVDVDWTATGGTISGSGLYTAGRAPGTYEVTATSKADPNLRGTATVTIVEIKCPIGTWEMLNVADFIDQIAGQFATAGGAEVSYGGGRYLLTFAADGRFLGQRIGLTVVASVDEGSFVTILDFEDGGTWSHDEKSRQLTVNQGVSAGTGRVIVEVDGQTFEYSQEIADVDGVGGTGSYECSGSNLTLAFPGYTVVLGPVAEAP